MACLRSGCMLLYLGFSAATGTWTTEVSFARSSNGTGVFDEWTVDPICRIYEITASCRGVAWRYGSGAPTGLDSTVLPGLGTLTGIESLDWNDDGHVDIIVGLTDGSVLYFENDGTDLVDKTSVARPFAELTFDSTNLTNAAPLVCDLDKDKVVDLIIGYTQPDGSLQVDAYLSGFDYIRKADYLPACCESSPGDTFKLQAVDVDKDSDVDFVVSGGAKLEYFENVKGEFVHWDGTSGTSKGPFEAIKNEFGKVVFADMNGDGELDVIGTSRFLGVFAVAYQVRPGVFTRDVLPWMDEKCGADCLSFDVVDVNADGAPDFVVAGGGGTRAFASSPSGTLTKTRQAVIEGLKKLRAPFVADWDGDNWPDVVACCVYPDGATAPRLVVARQDPERGFMTNATIELGAPAGAAVLVDLNGDAMLGVITHGWYQNPQPLTFYTRGSAGALTQVTADSLGIDLGPITEIIGTDLAVTPVDVNGDHLVDLVVYGGTGWGAGTAAFLILRTSTGWDTIMDSPLANVSCPASCEPSAGDPEHFCRVDIVDFDQDGRMDAFTWSTKCGLSAFHNDGEFLVETTLPMDSTGKVFFSPWTDTGMPWSGAGMTHLRTTFFDENHDGLMDLAVGSETTQVSFFANSMCTMPNPCRGRGACNPTTGNCSCTPGYAGSDCASCAESWFGVSNTLNAVRPFSCVKCPDCTGQGRCLDDGYMKSVAETQNLNSTFVWLAMGNGSCREACPVGHFFTGIKCLKCPSGTFSSETNRVGMNSCNKCPRGTYLATNGGSSKEDCLACSGNNPTVMTGATDVTACILPDTNLEVTCVQGAGLCQMTLTGQSLPPYTGQSLPPYTHRMAVVQRSHGCGMRAEDTAGNATDSGGYGCNRYTDYPEHCGAFDDDDFTANEACCVCSGVTVGDWLSPIPIPRASNLGVSDAGDTASYWWGDLPIDGGLYQLCWCSGFGPSGESVDCIELADFPVAIGTLILQGPLLPTSPTTLVRGEVYTSLGPIEGEGIDNETDFLKVMTVCDVGEFLAISDMNKYGSVEWMPGGRFSLLEGALSVAPFDHYFLCWCKTDGDRRCDRPSDFKVVAAWLRVVGVGRGQEKDCVAGQLCPVIAEVAGLNVAKGDRIAVQLRCGVNEVVAGFPGQGFAEFMTRGSVTNFTFVARLCPNSVDGWSDIHGYTCDDYVDSEWCSDGAAGRGWLALWGPLETYASSVGDSALTACCGCQAPASSRRLDVSCVDTSATDTYGYGCAYYNANTEYCHCVAEDCPNGTGYRDDDDFTAATMCCGCSGSGSCVDTSANDSYGNGCAYYNANTEDCTVGYWDDDDFTAATMCCDCAAKTTTTTTTTPCVQQIVTLQDAHGDGCDYYDMYPFQCGVWDDNDFKAHKQCCVCRDRIPCVDTQTHDTFGDGCSYYASYTEDCFKGYWDDEDFTAGEMCCACNDLANSGGPSTTTQSPSICTNMDFAVVDSEGKHCQEYDDFASECGSRDTGNFSAHGLCCGCGGGSTCTNLDLDFGATDPSGFGCAIYNYYPDACGCCNDADFSSDTMCCVCGCMDSANGAVDRQGHSCYYYDGRMDECGTLDDEDFTANRMCCVCLEALKPVLTTTAQPCVDDDTSTDSEGKTCDAYTADASMCGLYDSEAFTAARLCCMCRGVRPEVACGNKVDEASCPYGVCKWEDGKCKQVYWKTKGDCEVDLEEPNCVMSSGFSSGSYGNEEECHIYQVMPTRIQVQTFKTEFGYDVLSVNGYDYSGRQGPDGVVANMEGLSWSTDPSIVHTGWKLCLAIVATDHGLSVMLNSFETYLSANPGIYRMCYCRPSRTSACTTGDDFRADAGLFTVRGPYSLTLECTVGNICTLPLLRGVGLSDGDQIELRKVLGRQVRPCRGYGTGVAEFHLPDRPITSTAEGSLYHIGKLSWKAVPGAYAMCWRPSGSPGHVLEFNALAGWLAVSCPPGYFGIQPLQALARCLNCTKGYYCAGGTSSVPAVKTRCPQFESTPERGAKSASECQCIPGYNRTSEGTCSRCAAGRYRPKNESQKKCLECPTRNGPLAATELSQCTCPPGEKKKAATDPLTFQCEPIDPNETADFEMQASSSTPGLNGSLTLVANATQTSNKTWPDTSASLEYAALLSLSRTTGVSTTQISASATRRLAPASSSASSVDLIWQLQVSSALAAADAKDNFDRDEFVTGFLEALSEELRTSVSNISAEGLPQTLSVRLDCSTLGEGFAFPFGTTPTSLSQCECTVGYGGVIDVDGVLRRCEICKIGSYKEVISVSGCNTCGAMKTCTSEFCPDDKPHLTTRADGSVSRSLCECPAGYYYKDAADKTNCTVCGRDYYCEGGGVDRRHMCRNGSTTIGSTTATRGDQCSCDVPDDWPGRSPGPDCSCMPGYYFDKNFPLKCEGCPASGVNCPGGFDNGAHTEPKALEGYYMTSFAVAHPCRVMQKNGLSSVCLGHAPWCAEGHTGPLCGACVHAFSRDAGGRKFCRPCEDLGHTGWLLVGTAVDLFFKALWATVIGKCAITTATETESVASVVYRIWMQWMAVNGVLQHVELSHIHVYGWAQPLACTTSLLFQYPKWFSKAWSWVFSWAGTLPDVNVGTNQEVMECLAVQMYEGDRPRMAKYLFPMIWWLLYPVVLNIWVFVILIFVAKAVYPRVQKRTQKSREVLKRMIVRRGAKPESVDASFALITDRKISLVMADPGLLTNPHNVRLFFGTLILAEILAHITWTHTETQMKALGRDEDFLIKVFGVILDGSAPASIVKHLSKIESVYGSKANDITSRFKIAFSSPEKFANFILDMLSNVEEDEVINSVGRYTSVNFDEADDVSAPQYKVFNMFRSTDIKHVIVDSLPIGLVAVYSIWDMLTKRFLLALETTVISLAEADGRIHKQYHIWIGDTRLQVFDGDHLVFGMLASLGLTVWSVLFLFCIYIFLRKHKHSLMEPKITRTFGFFFSGLEPGYFYWELGIKRIDVLVVYVVTFMQFSPDVKALLVVYLLIAGVVWALHNVARPFDNRLGGITDRLESRGLATRFFTLALIQILLVAGASSELNTVCAVVILAVNVYFSASTAFIWLMEVLADEDIADFKPAAPLVHQDGEVQDGPMLMRLNRFKANCGQVTGLLLSIPRMLMGPITRTRRRLERRVPQFEWLGPRGGCRIHTWEDTNTGRGAKCIHKIIRQVYRLGDHDQRALAAENCGLMLDHLLTNAGFTTLPDYTLDVIFALPIALRKCQVSQTGEAVSTAGLIKMITEMAELALQREDDAAVKNTISAASQASTAVGSTESLVQERKFRQENAFEFACSAEQICQGLIYLYRQPTDAIHELVVGAVQGMVLACAKVRHEQRAMCEAEHKGQPSPGSPEVLRTVEVSPKVPQAVDVVSPEVFPTDHGRSEVAHTVDVSPDVPRTVDGRSEVLLTVDGRSEALQTVDGRSAALHTVGVRPDVPQAVDVSPEVLQTDDGRSEVPQTGDVSPEVLLTVDGRSGVLPSVDVSPEVPQTVDGRSAVFHTLEVSPDVPQTVDGRSEVLQTVDVSTEAPQTVDGSSEVLPTVDVSPDVPRTVDGRSEVLHTVDVNPEVPQTVEGRSEVPQTVDVSPEVPQTVEVSPEVLQTVEVETGVEVETDSERYVPL